MPPAEFRGVCIGSLSWGPCSSTTFITSPAHCMVPRNIGGPQQLGFSTITNNISTQWMIRWNNKGYVGWDCCEGVFEDDTVLESDGLHSGAIDSDAFGHFVGIEFTTEDDVEEDRTLTITRSLSQSFTSFHDLATLFTMTSFI
ncbi:hypothetical protein EDB82DRAFT_575659 [Fusarium venenatum]|uniref:uncharacterized protein n=1 Tax=Fusarium venenatum TaxID=56646 RepID=UPI001D8D2D05|nr:hypothetical protein EDB82DRAFT_575659 [Fusarium venenatum]